MWVDLLREGLRPSRTPPAEVRPPRSIQSKRPRPILSVCFSTLQASNTFWKTKKNIYFEEVHSFILRIFNICFEDIFWYLFLSLKTSEGTWISSLAWRCLSRLPSDVYVFRGPEIGGKAINRCEGDGPGQVQSTVERWGHLLAICSPDSSTIVTLQDQALTLIQFKSWRPFYF